MKRYLNALLLVLSLHVSLADAHAQGQSDSWTKTDMNPLPVGADRHDKTIKNISCGSDCKFELHYFRGKHVPGGKNILFISGGPGNIEKRDQRSLEFLEDKHNVFYFDIRGAGFSAIATPKRFDTALRATHVVEDIERIRRAALRDPRTRRIGIWDAVYGHSHGTIVAQRYAKSSPSGSPRLRKLILSAPLSRLKDFEEARIDMLANNLKSIYENYRQQTASQQCPPGAPPSFGTARGTDNFCFLSTGSNGMVDKLVSKFKRKLTELSEKFGSVAFVAEYFDKIIEEEPDALKFPSTLPYPKLFYLAVQRLAIFGATEPHPLQAADRVREIRVNAAFLLGYYLNLNEPSDFKPGAELNPEVCQTGAPFFQGVTNRTQDDLWKLVFCERFLRAVSMLKGMDGAVAESKRANSVYGLNDGIARFIFAILNVNPTASGCIDSQVVKDFADDANANTHKGARAVVRRIGIDLSEPICLWNPEEHAHGIPTLILKGGADPLISGCQAENVFTKGLTGERVLLDFPGVGHFMQLPNSPANGTETNGRKALLMFVDTFLKKTAADFSNDDSVKKLKDIFGVTMHTATGPGGSDICPH